MTNLGIFFSQPENAIYFLALPLLLVLLFFSKRYRERLAQALALTSKEARLRAPKNRILKNSLFLIGITFLIFAALGPQWGQKQHTIKAEGLDICFALDLSKSMLAEDASPSRLGLAKNQLTIFLPRLGGDRAALVGFAGSGFVAAPLSTDHNALIGFLEPLAPDFVSNPSTNLASGVDACMTALNLEDVSDPNEIIDLAAKLIVVISDGEDKLQDFNNAVERAQTLGVPIYAMAVGTAKGAAIPIRDEKGFLRSYLKAPQSGQPVITKLADTALKELAEKTGGKVFYLATGIDAWRDFEDSIANYKRDSRDAGTRLDREERFQIPLLLAFIFLLLDFWLPENGRRKKQETAE